MTNTVFKLLLILTIIFVSGATKAQEVELLFSHKLHAEDVEASCTDCHAAADTSSLSSHNLLPDMDTCYNCHDTDAECSLCHKDPDNAVAYPRITTYIAKFPHVKHVSQEIECSTCHANVAKSDNIFDSHLPTMSSCVTCHSDVEKIEYCFDCHASQEDLKPVDHKLDWTKAHGPASHIDESNCEMCHSDNQCLECHQQDNLDRKVHPLNYRNNHSLFAKGNKDNCYTCHEELSFCSDCHRQELVLPRNHSSAGWSNLNNGGGHARAAKLDLDDCLSCHNDSNGEPICAQCHQAK